VKCLREVLYRLPIAKSNRKTSRRNYTANFTTPLFNLKQTHNRPGVKLHSKSSSGPVSGGRPTRAKTSQHKQPRPRQANTSPAQAVQPKTGQGRPTRNKAGKDRPKQAKHWQHRPRQAKSKRRTILVRGRLPMISTLPRKKEAMNRNSERAIKLKKQTRRCIF
jgi:hypothetical protein